MTTQSPFDWQAFLQQVSGDLLSDPVILDVAPDEAITACWLGYESASEDAIWSLEHRLGVRLPPSYRSFLAASNGWRNCGPFIDNLWPCDEVRWFNERNQDWIDAYMHPYEKIPELCLVCPEGMLQTPTVTDEEYFTYGENQNPGHFRTEYLQTALEISDRGDSAILLLNPQIVRKDGEWEAWLFANWLPGAKRYGSFLELMRGEHESFLQIRLGEQ
jgi:hypothetical protein